MNSIVREGTKYIGISNEFPKNVKYFTDFILSENITLYGDNGELDRVLSVQANVNILDVDLINTPSNISYEGEYLSGKKIIGNAELNIKIKYISRNSNINITRIYFVKGFSIIVPRRIDNMPIEEIIRKSRFRIIPFIEDIFYEKVSKVTINLTFSILIEIDF